MQTWLKLFAALFTAAIMFSAGAAASDQEIRRISADRNLMVRAFLANVVVVPILAAALAEAFRMKGEFAMGAVLAAICPGAPFGTYLASRTQGNMALAVVLTSGLTVVSLVTAPITSLLLFGPANIVSLPLGLGLLITVLIVLSPVVLGQALRRRSPAAATRLGKTASAFAFASLIAGSVAAMGLRSEGVRSIGWRGSALVLSLVVLSMAAGWLFGTSPNTRTTLATSTGLRGVGLAYLFAEYTFPGSRVGLGVAAYSILMLIPNFALAALARRRQRPRAAPEERAA